MGAWVETHAPHFSARHDERDDEDVATLLELLEGTREMLAERFAVVPEHLEVVVHGSRGQLWAAQPELPVLTRLTAPASRRYLVGWPAAESLHLLAPRLAQPRGSNVPGSREMLALAPAALLSQVVVGANGRLPPPWGARALVRLRPWAWLWAGAGQHLAGQTRYARPAIARRLHEGAPPDFPPSLRDAGLLGGSVVDLLAREEGEAAVTALVTSDLRGGPGEALQRAFHGRSVDHTEGTWRGHLARIAALPSRETESRPPDIPPRDRDRDRDRDA